MVMDLHPWPESTGFQGTQEWWAYVLSKDEKKRLDHLLGAALLDNRTRQRLVNERDESLLNAYGFSEMTKQWIRAIDAESLTDFARAIVTSYRKTA